MRFIIFLITFVLIFNTNGFALQCKQARATLKDAERYSGVFLWKPVADHFPDATIVAPKELLKDRPTVELFYITKKNKLRKIETAKLKSRGLECTVIEECLGADTFLVSREGAYYQRKYPKGIVVRFTVKERNYCFDVTVKRPKNRAGVRAR